MLILVKLVVLGVFSRQLVSEDFQVKPVNISKTSLVQLFNYSLFDTFCLFINQW